jgi:rhomboid protease GluP
MKFKDKKITHKMYLPLATLTILILTAIVTSLQFFYPEIINMLSRNPNALLAGEWWRLISPVFINPEGLNQIIFNFSALIFLGVIVEKFYGSFRWLIFYFAAGFTGEIAGYLWQPESGGSSVAIMGLLGALLIWIILNRRSVPVQIQIWGPLGLIFAVILTFSHNIHGPSILVGALIALLMLKKDIKLKNSHDKI